MASNPTSPVRVEFGDIEDLQSASPGDSGVLRGVHGKRSAIEAPFAALSTQHGRSLRVAILSDCTRISYANGAVFQTRFLYQELRRAGHEVTIIGPADPNATPDEIAPGTVVLPSVPLKAYPGLYIPLPLALWIFDRERW